MPTLRRDDTPAPSTVPPLTRFTVTCSMALALGCAAPTGGPPAGAPASLDSRATPTTTTTLRTADVSPRCAVTPTVVARKGSGWSDRIVLPATGRLFLESHLATTADVFDGREFPSSAADRIEEHLARSCALLRRQPLRQPADPDCADVYRTRFHKEFTPAEGGGGFGQGSRGNLKPRPEEEPWILNMMFAAASLPRAGERWLVSANGRWVVAVAGYEIGPGRQALLGGVQGEVHWYLGTGNDSPVTIHGPLRDQSVTPGPVQCD